MSDLNVFHNPETGKDIILNPRNTLMAEHRLNTVMRYAINHAFSLHVAKRQATMKDYPLVRRGFDCVPVITQETASKLMHYLKTEYLDKQALERTPDQQEFPLKDKKLFMGFLEEIFQGTVDDMILSYFQSEYTVLFCSMIVTYPVSEKDITFKGISFKWHSDVAPDFHLKLLVHLNDAEEHKGGTRCIHREQTKRFKEIGYVFNDLGNRLSDLTQLAKQFNIDYQEELLSPRTGEAIIFQPSNVLHRGSWPQKGPRYIINLGLVPSRIHWREMVEQDFEPIVNNTESIFPELKVVI